MGEKRPRSNSNSELSSETKVPMPLPTVPPTFLNWLLVEELIDGLLDSNKEVDPLFHRRQRPPELPDTTAYERVLNDLCEAKLDWEVPLSKHFFELYKGRCYYVNENLWLWLNEKTFAWEELPCSNAKDCASKYGVNDFRIKGLTGVDG